MHHSSPPDALKAGRFHPNSLLIIPLVLSLAIALGGIGLVLWGGQRSVERAVQRLQQELTARIEDKLDTYSDIPHSINQLNAIAVAQGAIDVNQSQGHYPFWQQMQIYPSVSYIYCGSEQGAFLGVKRNPADQTLQLRMSNTSTDQMIYVYELDAQGNSGQLLEKRSQPYDPRVRPWYQAATAAGQPTWSDIYLDFSTLEPTLTASVPVYDPSTAASMGSCATDFYLPAEMSKFLSTLAISETGVVFVMERSGQLVATSATEPMLIGSGDQTDRLFAQDSENPTIQAIATELRDRRGEFEQITSIQDLRLTINGETQFVDVVPFQNRNLDWLIVIATPKSAFTAPLLTSRDWAIGLSLLAMAIAVGMGVWFSRWLQHTLTTIAQTINALASGTYRGTHFIVSSHPMIEVNSLTQAVNTLASYLRTQASDRTQQTAVLQQAADYYRQIYEHVPAGLFQATPDGRFICVNPAMAAICGYRSADEMINSITNISTQIYVNADDQIEFYRRINQSGQVKNFEHLVYRKDGSSIWVREDTRVVRDSNGKLIYYEGMVQDISDRKRLETDYRSSESPISLNDASPPSHSSL